MVSHQCNRRSNLLCSLLLFRLLNRLFVLQYVPRVGPVVSPRPVLHISPRLSRLSIPPVCLPVSLPLSLVVNLRRCLRRFHPLFLRHNPVLVLQASLLAFPLFNLPPSRLVNHLVAHQSNLPRFQVLNHRASLPQDLQRHQVVSLLVCPLSSLLLYPQVSRLLFLRQVLQSSPVEVLVQSLRALPAAFLLWIPRDSPRLHLRQDPAVAHRVSPRPSLRVNQVLDQVCSRRECLLSVPLRSRFVSLLVCQASLHRLSRQSDPLCSHPIPLPRNHLCNLSQGLLLSHRDSLPHFLRCLPPL